MIRVKDLDVKLKELRGKLTDPIALIGFPGIAMVGKLAILNIANSLDAVPCQSIYFTDFPSKSLISREGLMRIPKASISIARDVSNRDFLFISSDFQPITQAGIYEFSDFICNTCKELEVQTIVATGAFVPQKPITNDRKVYVSGTSKETIDYFLASKTGSMTLFKGGYITGANGVIPAWGSIHYDIEGACLLADALSMLQYDPKASKALVEVISERYELPINMEDLNKEIENIEQIASQLTDVIKEDEKKAEKHQPYFG